MLVRQFAPGGNFKYTLLYCTVTSVFSMKSRPMDFEPTNSSVFFQYCAMPVTWDECEPPKCHARIGKEDQAHDIFVLYGRLAPQNFYIGQHCGLLLKA